MGFWKIASKAPRYEFRALGEYWVHEPPVPYHLLAGGTQLTWGPFTLNRISGNLPGIAGEWHTAGTPEEVWTFLGNGTYSVSYLGDQTTGEYLASSGTLALAERKATVTETSGTIALHLPSGATDSGTWTISGDLLTLSLASGTQLYTRD